MAIFNGYTKDQARRLFALLDTTTGRLPDNKVPQTVLDRLTALETAPAPPAPLPGVESQIFQFRYNTDPNINEMVAGNWSDWWEVPIDGSVEGPALQADDYSSDTATKVTLFKYDNTAGAWQDMYDTTKPTLAINSTFAKGGAPVRATVAKGDRVRMGLLTVPPAPSTSSTAATHPVAPTGYGDGQTDKVNTRTIPMPAGSVGDVVMLIITGPSTLGTLPAGWQVYQQKTTTPNGRQTFYVLLAQWDAALANTFTFTSTTVTVGAPILLRNVDINNIGQVALSDGTEQQGAGSFSTPTLTASADCDFIILGAGMHYPGSVDGYKTTWAASGGPAGAAKAVDVVSGQGTQFDWGFTMGFANGVTSGTAVAAQPITMTGGTGSLANTSYLSFAILVRRKANSHQPTKITAQWTVRGN